MIGDGADIRVRRCRELPRRRTVEAVFTEKLQSGADERLAGLLGRLGCSLPIHGGYLINRLIKIKIQNLRRFLSFFCFEETSGGDSSSDCQRSQTAPEIAQILVIQALWNIAIHAEPALFNLCPHNRRPEPESIPLGGNQNNANVF